MCINGSRTSSHDEYFFLQSWEKISDLVEAEAAGVIEFNGHEC